MNADQSILRELITRRLEAQRYLDGEDLTRRTAAALHHRNPPRRRTDIATWQLADLEHAAGKLTGDRAAGRRGEERAALGQRAQRGLDLENPPASPTERHDAIRERGRQTTILRARRRRTQHHPSQGRDGRER